MGENTAIEWADHTFNPWIGCQRVSAACDHCYAETLMDTRLGAVEWGPGKPRKRTSEANWRQPLKWDRQAAKSGKQARVFCASLADVFDNAVPEEWRADLWQLIDDTPHLTWMLLTKRPQNIRKMEPKSFPHFYSRVWLGITAEDQPNFDRRWRWLDGTGARVRFISYEPALGPLSLRSARPEWVICGGESGPNARPINLPWARDIRDECREAGVPFFFKQWGEHAPVLKKDGQYIIGGRGDPITIRVGKKRAGRLLDGRTWVEFPG